MSQILLQDNAEKNLLQATEGEVNIVITFCDEIIQVYQVTDSSPEKLEALYGEIRGEYCGGGTDIYLAAERGLSLIADGYDPEDYTPAIILMTDGMSMAAKPLRILKRSMIPWAWMYPFSPSCSETQRRSSWMSWRS